jgi:hypothetical protein
MPMPWAEDNQMATTFTLGMLGWSTSSQVAMP